MSNSTPPDYDSKKHTWKTYKKEVEVWSSWTKLEDAKKGPALWSTLTGKAKEAVQEMELDEIKAADGLTKILNKLDEVFKTDINQEAYLAYRDFETFSRSSDMSMMDFAVKFEALNLKISKLDMKLPEGVLAYRFLHSANLSDEQMNLCRATMTEFKYKEMKQKILNLYGDKVQNTIQQKIKEEPVFYGKTSEHSRGGYNRGYYQRGASGGERGGYVAQSSGGRGQYHATQTQKQTNPPGRYGTPSTCACCGSRYHWFKECPDRTASTDKKRTDQAINYCEHDGVQGDVRIELFQQASSDDQLKLFVGETIGCAVIDSGCSKTVAGNQWISCYLEQLDEENRRKVEKCYSGQTFRFGPGDALTSMGKVKLPAKIGTKNVLIETDIVDADIPLLLSKEALKNAGTLLDFDNDHAIMFGEKQFLISTKSGHYAIPLLVAQDLRKHDEHIVMLTKTVKDISADPKKIAEKLHRQFCHCSDIRLIKLVQVSNLWEDKLHNEIIDEIKSTTKNCKICKQFESIVDVLNEEHDQLDKFKPELDIAQMQVQELKELKIKLENELHGCRTEELETSKKLQLANAMIVEVSDQNSKMLLSNKQLEDSNTRLKQSNSQLKQSMRTLAESNSQLEQMNLQLELSTGTKSEWVSNQDQQADCLIKQGADSNKLLGALRQGYL